MRKSSVFPARPKLLEIESIHKDETVLLGYLSSVDGIVGDEELSAFFGDSLNKSLKDGKGSRGSPKPRSPGFLMLPSGVRVRTPSEHLKESQFILSLNWKLSRRILSGNQDARLFISSCQAIGERTLYVYLT